MESSVIYFLHASGRCSSIVEFSVIFFGMPVKRALVLWNFVLYISVCGMRSGIVQFCVICFCAWNAPWYCRILCCIFLHMERALVLCYVFPRVKRALVLWNSVL